MVNHILNISLLSLMQRIEDLEKKCLEDHKQSYEYKTPMKSLNDGLSKEQQRMETITNHLDDYSRPASRSSCQYFLEVVIALLIVGLLLLLCNFISRGWRTRFQIEMLNAHRPS